MQAINKNGYGSEMNPCLDCRIMKKQISLADEKGIRENPCSAGGYRETVALYKAAC
jgi:hypothetical protein